MTRKTIANFLSDIEVVLEDTAYAIFPEATITVALANGLRKISDPFKGVPDEVFHWMTARNKSKYIDISTWRDHIIKPVYAVYPLITVDTDGYLISDGDIDYNRRRVDETGDTIRMHLDGVPDANNTDYLTGTVVSVWYSV